MSEVSIEITNLSKTYRLYDSPIARIKEAFNPLGRKYSKEYRALEDVSLSIFRGETFALIGKNGAGKSTLLKILAGVVAPTGGEVIASGRIVALLELGAGFNPEMSGLENIFLFGAFHGLNHGEVDSILEEIVKFADIGDFINYPVKTYSSGMFVRLAFACSVHLKPDILIVDEALSVGDAKFQQKCFKFIEGLKEKGTTIVLVSHDLSLIKMVSDRACLIDHGRVLAVGLPKDIANMYFDLDVRNEVEIARSSSKRASHYKLASENALSIIPGDRDFGEGGGGINSVHFKTSGGFPYISGGDILSFSLICSWDPKEVLVIKERGKFDDNVIAGLSISDRFGNYIFGMTTVDKDVIINLGVGGAEVSFEVSMPELKSDDYLINVSLALGTQAHHTTIAWYEAIHIMQFRSKLKNVYGWMHPGYNVRI